MFFVLAHSRSRIRGSASGLRSPFCYGVPGGASCSRVPSSGRLSCPCLASTCGGIPCLRPALPYYAADSNASGFAAAALSAPLASSMLAVPLSGPGIASVTGSAAPTSCTSTPADSTASASVFMAALAAQDDLGLHGPHSERAHMAQAHVQGIDLRMRTRAKIVINYLIRCMWPNVPRPHKHLSRPSSTAAGKNTKLGNMSAAPAPMEGQHTVREMQQPDISDPRLFKARAVSHTSDFHPGKVSAHSLDH